MHGSVNLDWAGGGLLLISLEFCYSSDKLSINHPGWVIKQNKSCLAALDPVRNSHICHSTQSICAVYLQPSMCMDIRRWFSRFGAVTVSFPIPSNSAAYIKAICAIRSSHWCLGSHLVRPNNAGPIDCVIPQKWHRKPFFTMQLIQDCRCVVKLHLLFISGRN